MKKLVEDTRMVMWRMGPMAEIFLDYENVGPQRLSVWNSLMTTVVYMGGIQAVYYTVLEDGPFPRLQRRGFDII